MRFAFKVFQQATTWEEIRDIWRLGDDLDIFEAAWTYDHLVGMEPQHDSVDLVPERPTLEGWALLAALATQTKRLRIGNLVTCVPFRHPAVLAKMAATIDEISGGRLEMGIGAGWLETEAAMYGIEFDTFRDRLARLEEAVQVINALFTTDRVDHEGRFYALRGARIEPKPKGTKIWIGGKANGTLRIVAKYADAWNYSGVLLSDEDLGVFRAKREFLAERCAAEGREGEVLVSAEFGLRGDPAALTEAVAGWAEAGAQYIGIMLLEDISPKKLEQVAQALEPLRNL